MKYFIHENTLKDHKSASGKAIYFTARFGLTDRFNRTVWFPLSQMRFGEVNEVGWMPVEIPDWLIKKNDLQNATLEELQGFSSVDEKEVDF